MPILSKHIHPPRYLDRLTKRKSEKNKNCQNQILQIQICKMYQSESKKIVRFRFLRWIGDIKGKDEVRLRREMQMFTEAEVIIHSVSDYKKRVEFQTSRFLFFFKILYSFRFLLFLGYTVSVS